MIVKYYFCPKIYRATRKTNPAPVRAVGRGDQPKTKAGLFTTNPLPPMRFIQKWTVA
jgi:hypothetical protein